MKEKESESAHPPNSLRKEIWIHPDGGRRIHRTTTAVQEQKPVDSDEEDLASLSSVEVSFFIYCKEFYKIKFLNIRCNLFCSYFEYL